MPLFVAVIFNRSRSKWVRARPVTHWDGSKIGVTIFISPNPRPTALLLRCSMCVNELLQFWADCYSYQAGVFFMSTWKAIRHSVYIALVFPAHTTASFMSLNFFCCENKDLCNTHHGNFWWHRTFQFQFMFVWRGRQLKGLGLLIVIHSKLTAGKLVFTR